VLTLPGCVQRRASGFNHTLTVSRARTRSRVRLFLLDTGGNHPQPEVAQRARAWHAPAAALAMNAVTPVAAAV
jgi:hypothetical protein